MKKLVAAATLAASLGITAVTAVPAHAGRYSSGCTGTGTAYNSPQGTGTSAGDHVTSANGSACNV